MCTSKQRLSTEKKLNSDYFRVKAGTMNKSNPQVLYIEGRTFISPQEEDDYYSYMNHFRKNMNNNITENIRKFNCFDSRYILDFQVANSGIKVGKRSFLSFQLFLRQKQDNIKSLKDMKCTLQDFMDNVLFSLKKDIIDCGFNIYKSKKEEKVLV
jgi:phage antirepressor YoqD-like protein